MEVHTEELPGVKKVKRKSCGDVQRDSEMGQRIARIRRQFQRMIYMMPY